MNSDIRYINSDQLYQNSHRIRMRILTRKIRAFQKYTNRKRIYSIKSAHQIPTHARFTSNKYQIDKQHIKKQTSLSKTLKKNNNRSTSEPRTHTHTHATGRTSLRTFVPRYGGNFAQFGRR